MTDDDLALLRGHGMSDDDFAETWRHVLKEMVYNLEQMAIAFLPEEDKRKPFSEALLAKALAGNARASVAFNMALFVALTHPDADYKLEIKENTKKHPGGVPKFYDLTAKIERAEAVRAFIDDPANKDTKQESLIADAEVRFGVKRAALFEALRMGRYFHSQKHRQQQFDSLPHLMD